MKKPTLKPFVFSLFGILIATAASADDSASRTQRYPAVKPPGELQREMKTGNFSIYENPTGIWFPADSVCTVTVNGELPSAPLRLRIADFTENARRAYRDYPITNQTLTVSLRRGGMTYLNYEATDYQNQPEIEVTIGGGEVNGVFRAGDSNETWKTLLKNAKGQFLDLYGKHVHLVFQVKDLQQHCPENGEELLARYDTIIGKQQKVAGFGYNRPTYPNRMFGRVVFRGYMFADGTGAGFNANTMGKVLRTDRMRMDDFWGIAHEFGHIHQTRPGFRWHGLIEVTNNMLAMACAYELNPNWLRLDGERMGKHNLAGGRYTSFTQSALINKELFMLQAGGNGTGHTSADGGDVFARLIPFWQLYLYTAIAELGNKDFYPALHDWLRRHSDDSASPGQHQLNFMRMACEINRQDLTDYFETVGMLKPISVELKDYGQNTLTITEEDCNAVKAFAAQFPKPPTAWIQYLNSFNVKFYKEKLPLKGPDAPGEGIELKDGQLTVSHDVWQNPVAFEVYAGDKLTDIILSYTGARVGDELTRVSVSPETTDVWAVGWNGGKKLVYRANR